MFKKTFQEITIHITNSRDTMSHKDSYKSLSRHLIQNRFDDQMLKTKLNGNNDDKYIKTENNCKHKSKV